MELASPVAAAQLSWQRNNQQYVDIRNHNRCNLTYLQKLTVEDALIALNSGAPPPLSVSDLLSIVKNCRHERKHQYALLLHSHLQKLGLDAHHLLGNGIVPLLVESGNLVEAQKIFDKLAHRNYTSWSFLISGYVNSGQFRHGLALFWQMQDSHGCGHLNGYVFVATLKACARLKDLESGLAIHAEIARNRLLRNDIYVGNALIDMYMKIGYVESACEVFVGLPILDVISWNTVITGYVEHGYAEMALNLFEEMQTQGFSPSVVTYVCCLKACGSLKDVNIGETIHLKIIRAGLQTDLAVVNALIDMYVKCCCIPRAWEVFCYMEKRDIISWTTLLSGYTEHGYGKEALKCYKHMKNESIIGDGVMFLCVLKACGSICDVHETQEVHLDIAKLGLLESDQTVGNALVDVYSKCGLLGEMQYVFDMLAIQDLVSWNALISGYTEHTEKAFECFEEMKTHGVSPDASTFGCMLKACSFIESKTTCQKLHTEIMEKGYLDNDLAVGNALVDVYGKCGLLDEAIYVFNKLPDHDVTSWNVIIGAYVESGSDMEALECFEKMKFNGVSPDVVSFVWALKSCASLGATEKADKLYAQIIGKGFLEVEQIGKALVDMYVKCGSVDKAHRIFRKLHCKDVVSWTALITGYTQSGDFVEVFSLFDNMISDGVKPSLVTFFSILSACCHAGLVEKGEMYFQTMIKTFGILPTLEHYTCMVDLHSRAGQLDKALSVIEKMPFIPDHAVWHILLGASQKWGDVQIARLAFARAVELDKNDCFAYVCMSNIYSDANMKEDAMRIEQQLRML